MQAWLGNIASLWNLALLVGVGVTLGLFLYSVFLKKVIRIRRIANARSKRLMKEAAERE
jgi:hypothetical protein